MKYFTLLLIVFLTLLSCTKEQINSKPKADFTFTDEIDHFVLNDSSEDIDGDVLTYKWVSMSDTIKIISTLSSTYFNLPKLQNSMQIKIKHSVNDGILSDSIIKEITLPKTTSERLYGLGLNLKKEQINNVSYNWYYDQFDSGTYASINCGPASVTMAIKWANVDFNKTPEDARNTYRSSGGWWYTSDIINYLNVFSVNNYTVNIACIDSIQSIINSKNIVILCVDMFYIRNQGKYEWHVDRFYPANTKGWGHFIVIKGYKVIDNRVYYQTYDPYSSGVKYYNDTLKGVDRYYRSEDLNMAVMNWWNYAIIVSRSNLKNSHLGVDVSKIIHKSGS